MAWNRVGALRGPQGERGEPGKTGGRGAAGQDYQPPAWSTTGLTLKDNGTVGTGTGGAFRYRHRVDRGIFECFFDIRWGTSPTSRGGALRILIPQTPAGSMEAVGMGSYWSAAGQFGMDIYPFVAIGSREIRFMTPRNGNLLLQSEFQIWDGRNVKDTGIPANPGFILDANGSSLKGNIRFPV